MKPEYFPPSPEGILYACAFLAVNPAVFERRHGWRKRTFGRHRFMVESRERVYEFVIAAWGWTGMDLQRQLSTNHSTIFTSLKRYGFTPEKMADYRRRLLAGEIYPATTALPSPPPPPPPEPVVQPVAEQAPEPPSTLKRNRTRSGYKSRKHADDCACAVCSDLAALAARLAARPDLQAKDVEFTIRDRFEKARAAMERGRVA